MKTSPITRSVLMIAGMRDNACRQKVVSALEQTTGVSNVDVNLYRGIATIIHDPSCDEATLMHIIEDAGYAAEPARRMSRDKWPTD